MRKINKIVKPILRFIMRWVIPIVLYIIGVVLAVICTLPITFKEGYFDMKWVPLVCTVAAIFSLLTTKIIIIWWSWLRRHDIIR